MPHLKQGLVHFCPFRLYMDLFRPRNFSYSSIATGGFFGYDSRFAIVLDSANRSLIIIIDRWYRNSAAQGYHLSYIHNSKTMIWRNYALVPRISVVRRGADSVCTVEVQLVSSCWLHWSLSTVSMLSDLLFGWRPQLSILSFTTHLFIPYDLSTTRPISLH